MTDQSDAEWAVQPLLDAGFPREHLKGLSEWIQFEAIAAEEEQRPVSLREIDSHLAPEMREALREVVRRLGQRGDR